MSYESYTCVTELFFSCISNLILVLQSIYLSYGSYTYGTYTCLMDLILVLQSLFLYFRSYTCITKHILVLWILYLRNIYLSYGSYTYIMELIRTYSYAKVPVGTISRNISKSYQIHTNSDQTYADTNISP